MRPSAAAVFTLAVGARLAYVLGANEPLLYSHPYNYFHGALSILENPRPLHFVLHSDAWHQWLGPWTIAPLYYLFLAALMAVFGPHLLPIRLAQMGLDGGVAVLVWWMGRRFAPRYGAWAGVLYALNAHAIEQAGQTLTENLHTPLLVAGLALLMAERGRPRADGDAPPPTRWGLLVAGGLVLGLSALARSVSAAFVPLALLWRWREQRGRPGLLAALVLAGAAAAPVVPWTARNVVLIGDWVPIETNGVFNLWDDNAFVEGDRRAAQDQAVATAPTLAEARARATRYAWRGIARWPARFALKAWFNALHIVRLDGLHLLLRVEEAQPAWRAAALVLLDDAMLLPTVALTLVFVLAGRGSPERRLALLWGAYYLFMVVIVFHNEIRYRSTLLPFALAAAAGGWEVLAARERWRERRVQAGAALGVLAAWVMLEPYPGDAVRALAAWRTAAQAAAAVRAGDLGRADLLAWRAANEDPPAVRPWLTYGRALEAAGQPARALEAYERAQGRKAYVWVPYLVRPRLLAEAGRTEEAEAATLEANRLSYAIDAWQALEVAWRELPPPRADAVLLARGDYGAARGFFLPDRGQRWSRGRAWLRLQPTVAAPAYDVSLEMGSPAPSPLEAPEVEVAVNGGPRQRVRLGRAMGTFTFRAPAAADGVLVVSLRAPTWSHTGESADQGARVAALRVQPARP